MIDKYFEWNIDGIQANTVLEGSEVTIPIEKSNYNDIFINKELLSFIKNNEGIFKEIFTSNDKVLDNYLQEEFHLDYHIKDNKYTIGYDYNKIINNVLKKLGISKEININLKSREEIDKSILKIKKEIAIQSEIKDYDGIHDNNNDILLAKLYDYLGLLIKTMLLIEAEIKHHINLQTNEEKELRDKHKALAGTKNKHISWKNLMYYTACRSLDEFIFTKDIKYYRYAKNYYKNVSTNPNTEYPKNMTVLGTNYDHTHTKFNSRFVAIQSHSFPSYLVRLNIEDKDRVTRRQTLKNGNGLKGIVPSENDRKNKKLDYSKINQSLHRKIKFYEGLSGKCQGIIDGLKGDTDYIGYVLDNNYVIFDKFYEVSKDGAKINPAYGNRVYIATLDVLEQCDYDRSKLRKYKKDHGDYKVSYYNHTDTGSYQERVKEVLDYHDISTIKFKELKLKNEKNN